ncbi:MAG: acetoacetate--CoA ligase [Alphaproteobacteria bacterium]|jgi:acetoacetyl-CoA synthetase
MTDPLWRPTEAGMAATHMRAFMRMAGSRSSQEFANFDALHAWSVAEPAAFWDAMWDFAGVVAETKGERVMVDEDKLPGARFFPDGKLNYAENLLRRTGGAAALIMQREDGLRDEWSWDELRAFTARISHALDQHHLDEGDRVAAYLPNMPEAIGAMLGAAAGGRVWSSCSPDFGVQGVLDRFGQIAPKIMFSVDGYMYGGKRIDIRAKVAEVMHGLDTCDWVVIIPFLDEEPDLTDIPRAISLQDFLSWSEPSLLTFKQLPFDHPLYILFSSGTTGAPKCIVHKAGGILLKHYSEHMLHTDVRVGDRLFYFTTLGWMMWNWLVGGLASGATLMLYDGSPFHPGPNVLWDFIEKERVTIYGTSAKYIDAISKEGLTPRQSHDLSAMRAMLSTGSVLVSEAYDYIYADIMPDGQMASVSGGTDLCGCLISGNPLGPVWKGEIQCKALGLDIQVYGDDGSPTPIGEKGELVCLTAFPSMPLGFWDDPEDARYKAAYYEHFPDTWHQGDYAAFTENGGIMIFGRSDATLNPGGVRIGTAEIYRQVEQLNEVVEGLVIGQEWDNDTRVVLFVRLREGLVLDDALIRTIRTRIREGASPRHVPAKVVQVTDIPRTRSGKIVELAVRDVVHGRVIKNAEALDNPHALEQFQNRPELAC